ncbi:hypothetical protein [Polymorphospora rubra]|uniref:hypothetical protein n=1 Tax=Polymorphospora rubra TaxID=338584 RepID=UPI001BB3E005|nr:hypothetical protein [Polymorphospora rubra]
MTIWAAGINFVFGALIYHAILTAGRQGAPAASIGLLLTLASVGGLVGALGAPLVFSRVRPMTVVVFASWAMVALVVVMSQARQTWTYGLLFGLVFLLSPLLGVIFQSRAIELTPDAMQGRVATVMGTVGEVLQTPAPLLAGVLVAWQSPTVVALVFAAALAVLAAYTTANLRRLGAPDGTGPDDDPQRAGPTGTDSTDGTDGTDGTDQDAGRAGIVTPATEEVRG